jgi:ApbE superfamily uncharacterized protein (UPF0280 family)
MESEEIKVKIKFKKKETERRRERRVKMKRDDANDLISSSPFFSPFPTLPISN